LKDEAEVRAAVDRAAMSGADSIAEVHFPAKGPPPVEPATEQESRNLAAGIDEANKLHLPFQVHAISAYAISAAAKLGARKMVHSPSYGWVTDEEAKEAKAEGVQMCSTTGYAVPVFGVFNHDDKPTFRDGKPWPQGIPDDAGRGREAGDKAVNARTYFDNGVELGYCTDTTFDASAALAHELKALNLVFSPVDLVKIMGQNSADFIDRGKDLGTLEPGKIADVLVLGGDPLDGYWNFLTTEVVIKGGVVVVDKRGRPDAGKPVARGS
jgi:imidazolonepropionase-like amidohydrolase